MLIRVELSPHYPQNGNIVTAGRDKTVKFWDGNGKAYAPYPALLTSLWNGSFKRIKNNRRRLDWESGYLEFC